MKVVKRVLLCAGVTYCLMLSSCIKESPEPEPAKCLHRYTSKVEVLSYPDDNYDFFNGPDLRADLKRDAANNWEFSTNVLWDVDGGGTLGFSSEIYLTNEEWVLRIVDDDSPDADDEICTDSFNPTKAGKDGRIVFKKNGVESVILHYVEREE